MPDAVTELGVEEGGERQGWKPGLHGHGHAEEFGFYAGAQSLWLVAQSRAQPQACRGPGRALPSPLGFPICTTNRQDKAASKPLAATPMFCSFTFSLPSL